MRYWHTVGMERDLYLVAYDVADERALRRMLKLVKGYATGGQKSVFECWLNAAERRGMLDAAGRTICVETDRFLIIRLDPRQRPMLLGRAEPVVNPWFFHQG